MNILVTVGTTKFDSLIRNVDIYAGKNSSINFIFQISEKGQYFPSVGAYFDFSDKIDELYDSADLIITHAGAGSIYKLLEMQKKIIIVPNFERVDKHQSDISSFMEKNKHALVCSDVIEIGRFIEMAIDYEFVIFKKIPFFKEKEIARFIFS
jgi:beta-1,4-N-acetylglucosaminyltransferase